MALTKAREIALFQILEVPYTTSVGYIYPDGLTAQISDVASSSIAAKNLITTFLTLNVYPDATLQAVLETLLDAWIALGTDTTSIVNGSVGNIAGVNSEPDAERGEIRKQTVIIVPYYRADEQLRRGTAMVPIIC